MLRAFITAALVTLVASPALAKPTISVDGPRVRLSHLLGEVAVDADVCAAPFPGYTRRILRRDVSPLVDGADQRRLRSSWVVRTESRELPCAELTKRVTSALASRLRPGLVVRSVDCRRPLILPRGELTHAVRIPPGTRLAGAVTVESAITVGDWPTQRIFNRVVIDGRVPVVVTRARTAGQSALTANLVRVEPRQASLLPGDVIGDLESLRGFVLRAPVATGTVLRRAHLQQVELVRRDAAVVVTASLPGVEVSCRGIAGQGGVKGDRVWVRCPNHRKPIKATVVAAGHVRVEL